MPNEFKEFFENELQQLNSSTSPTGKRALVNLVYSGKRVSGAAGMALESRKLIDIDGQPTALGRRFADFLTGGAR